MDVRWNIKLLSGGKGNVLCLVTSLQCYCADDGDVVRSFKYLWLRSYLQCRCFSVGCCKWKITLSSSVVYSCAYICTHKNIGNTKVTHNNFYSLPKYSWFSSHRIYPNSLLVVWNKWWRERNAVPVGMLSFGFGVWPRRSWLGHS